MFVDGWNSNVDLAKWMQASGDLKNAWMMFDHVKWRMDHHGMSCLWLGVL
jgi:hypothetical protein